MHHLSDGWLAGLRRCIWRGFVFGLYFLAGGGSSGKLYRVRVGPQWSRNAADTVATRLRKAGHKGAVVSQP